MAPLFPQPRSLLFPLSLSLSLKSQQEGPRKSPLWLGEGMWEAGASPTDRTGHPGTTSPVLAGGPQPRPALRYHPALPSPRELPNSMLLLSSPRQNPPSRTPTLRLPQVVPGPSKHIGVVRKPSEMTNKYFNHRLKKIRFKIKTLYPFDLLIPLHSLRSDSTVGGGGQGLG